MIQLIGWLATLMKVISMAVKNPRTLRWFYLAGCCFNIVYGFLLEGGRPVLVCNIILAIENIYHLFIKKNA